MKPSNEMQSLFAAAREDGPPVRTREVMWKEVELGLALVPTPAPSTASTASARPSSPPAGPPVPVTSVALKAGLIGGGVGSGITAIAVLLAVNAGAVGSSTPDPMLAVDHAREVSAFDRPPSMLAPFVGPAAERVTPSHADEERPVPVYTDEGDVLGREVSLVMGAREALLGDQPARALDLATRARALHGQLDREALTLQVRALRALGRAIEADRSEMELRVRHPASTR